MLDDTWLEVLQNDQIVASDQVRALVDSTQTAIRFCLPTQLLGKLVDPALDALCLQRGDGSEGRWDPRGFAATVVVPWNQKNERVLGPSGDPYVSNPLRRPRVDDALGQKSDPIEWGKLRDLLVEVQSRSDPEFTKDVFVQVLAAIRDRLRDLTFVYVVPPRVSARQAEELVKEFLSERSGGDRGLAVVAAIFEAIAPRFRLYNEIKRGVINASDASSNVAADLECTGPDGKTILAVEVKERRIDSADVQIAKEKARTFSVTEFLLCTEGIQAADQAAVEQLFANSWASGTNLYHATIAELLRGLMPVLGEQGIRDFIVQVGSQLDRFSTQPLHRKAWKARLDAL